MSIFCVATIHFQHCLNPLLGMEFTRDSQVATGVLFHSSMMTSQSWWMLETIALLHLPFEETPEITFTLSFFSKAVVVLEVCLGSLPCWNTALWPSLRRVGDHALHQYVTVHVGIHMPLRIKAVLKAKGFQPNIYIYTVLSLNDYTPFEK